MVVYPVVPQGVIILRLIPTAVHTFQQVYKTINAFKEIRENLIEGVYDRSEKPIQVINQILTSNLCQ